MGVQDRGTGGAETGFGDARWGGGGVCTCRGGQGQAMLSWRGLQDYFMLSPFLMF